MAATARILDFLRDRRPEGPCLVVDLEVIANNYKAFTRAMPDTRIFYAVKANPAPEVLKLLAGLGSCFDTASVAEIEMALAAGATPERISFGNTIKKERDIARAHQLGISMFAVDCVEEVEKVGARRTGCAGILPHPHRWRRGRMAAEPQVRLRPRNGDRSIAARSCAGPQRLWHFLPCGLAADPSWRLGHGAWRKPRRIFDSLAGHGITLSMVNLGGGFPTKYLKPVPGTATYANAIHEGLAKHFGNAIPETIIEPGRGMVGNAGVIKTEVVLISKKHANDNQRWVYLDIGKFGGLAETMDEAIRYPITTARDGDAKAPCVIAGPTCDSADVLYEKTPYDLPVTLSVGDEVLIEATGAYTTTYASVAFNGFAPLQAYVI